VSQRYDLEMRRWLRRAPELSTIAAAAAGAFGGVIAAQPVLQAVAPGCEPTAQAYGLCHPHVGTPWAVAIYGGLVLAGSVFGCQLGRLFSPTLRRFVGDAGTAELRTFRVRGDFARVEWLAQGEISITDAERSRFELHSGRGQGAEKLPAGRYKLKVAASGAWMLRVARG
jgi:hypothetical protein